jgi:hypothetical protein
MSRDEEDPIYLYKMLITTRDSMTKTKEMLIQEYYKRNTNIENLASSTDRNNNDSMYKNFASYKEKDISHSRIGGMDD